MGGTIFISYRRDDTEPPAGRLRERLERAGFKTFMDVSAEMGGQDYTARILTAVHDSDVLLALVGKRWLEGRRLEVAGDLLRREITTALGLEITVIPVLIDGAKMPSATELPKELKSFAGLHALDIANSKFDIGFAELIKIIKLRLGKPVVATRLVLVGVFCAVAVLGALMLWTSLPPQSTQPSEVSRPAEDARKIMEERVKAEAAAQREREARALLESTKIEAEETRKDAIKQREAAEDARIARDKAAKQAAIEAKRLEDLAAAATQRELEARKAAEQTAKDLADAKREASIKGRVPDVNSQRAPVEALSPTPRRCVTFNQRQICE